MKQEIQEILDIYRADIERHQAKMDKLIATMQFCDVHKFDEEARIVRVKYNSMQMILFDFKSMYDSLEKLI